MNDARSSTSTFRDAHTCPPRTRLKSQTRATRLKKRLTPCQSFESLIYRRNTIEGAPFFVQLWTTTRAARRWSGRSTTFGAINKIRFTCCASYRRDMKTRVTCIQWYVARASNSGRCVDWIQETDALVLRWEHRPRRTTKNSTKRWNTEDDWTAPRRNISYKRDSVASFRNSGSHT